MVLEERFEILKKLINERNIYNVNAISENVSSLELFNDLKLLQKPTIDEIKKLPEAINKLALENSPSVSNAQLSPSEEIEPYILNETEISLAIEKSSTIKPEFKLETHRGKEFQSIILNKKSKYFLGTFNEINFIWDGKNKIKYTEGLDQIIRGFGNINSNKDDINTYLNLFKDFGGSKSSKYYKNLKSYLEKEEEGLTIKEGEGLTIKEKHINPISLFIELKKYLAAKKAGHNNVDDKIKFILENLNKNKFINSFYLNKYRAKIF